MSRIAKHYSLECSGSIWLDSRILVRLNDYGVWIAAHAENAYAKATFETELLVAKGVKGGWRKRVLAIWPAIKPHIAKGTIPKLILREWRFRNKTFWAKCRWLDMSRKMRGKYLAKKKATKVMYNPIQPPPRMRQHQERVERIDVPERGGPPIEFFAGGVRLGPIPPAPEPERILFNGAAGGADPQADAINLQANVYMPQRWAIRDLAPDGNLAPAPPRPAPPN